MHKILIMTNFPFLIKEWYLQYGRELPWRNTTDSYKIWISEIILQQTQVKQGKDYYHNFLKTFPDAKALANASETQVLQQWQGLGYYSRARNIHHAAKTIVKQHNGLLPQTYKKIMTLKGIGSYTAAAIASFAYGLPYPVVDGNVFRLLSRIFAIDIPIDSSAGKKHFEHLAEALLDKNDPGTHNQAIMELGALICKPASPFCDKCPVAHFCKAFATGTQTNFPVKRKKPTRKKRYFNFLVIHSNKKLVVQKRSGKDIWQGLYQFPLIETDQKTSEEILRSNIAKLTGVRPKITRRAEKNHLLTHQELHTIFYNIEWPVHQKLPEYFNQLKNEIIPFKEVENLPFPQLIKENLKNIL